MKQFRDVFLFEEDERDFDHNGIGTLIDFVEEPEINRIINGRFSFLGKYAIDGQLADKIQKGMMIKAYCPDGTWQPFRIGKPIITLETIEFEARHYCFDANRNFVIDMFVSAGNGPKLMQELKNNLEFDQQFKYESDLATVHQFTAKEGHPIDILIGSNNGNQNMTGVTSGELDMHDNVISLKTRLGEDRGFRVDFGINLESIKETIEDEEPPNTLYLVGATPEGTYDDPPPPITVKYLEAPGIKVTDKNRVIRKYSNEECKTEEALIEWANKILFEKRKVHLPKTMHEISIVDLAGTTEYEDYENLVQLNIGDTVTGILQSNRAEITERMIEYTWYPRLGEYKAITLGNDLGFYTSKTQDGIKGALVELNKTENSLYEKILNATELITGTSSGHIMQYPKNEPYELRIMDTADAKTAKKVWRWNLGGLGYSKNGVNGPFELAMTQDGVIVADFIKAGTLEGIKIRSVNDNFAIQMDQGILSFRRIENGKETELFAFAPTFVENVLKGVNMIKAPGYEFGLSAQGQDGTYLNLLHIPADSSPADLKMTLYGKVNVDGDLLIKGQQVYPGQGGSGNGEWDGEYPPGVTSQADRFAWELWVYLLSKGYSKAAAAGILGNVQGEVGAGMNPDTAQSGGSGPGYGIVQWDGSSYPLVGAPTWNGRQYVQNLMNAAGITEDYKTMKAQAKLLDWCMYNGQWLGAVQPTSVAGFKAMTDPRQAAYVFEKNFERPATDHPERQGWAQEWYNKFKDLEITSGNKILTVAKSLLGYFHYSQPLRTQFGTVENPDPNGYADCSSFVWLVLTKAGCKTPAGVGWYTGSMTADARGAKNWLQEINQADAKAGDIVIVNQGSGAGNDGHTAILTENWNGYNTKIIEMGGANSNGVGYGVISTSFGWLLNGGDVCVARAKR